MLLPLFLWPYPEYHVKSRVPGIAFTQPDFSTTGSNTQNILSFAPFVSLRGILLTSFETAEQSTAGVGVRGKKTLCPFCPKKVCLQLLMCLSMTQHVDLIKEDTQDNTADILFEFGNKVGCNKGWADCCPGCKLY